MTEAFGTIFNFAVNLYQSTIAVYFLVECLGVNYKRTTAKMAYFVGITAQMIYLITLSYITSFENFGIFIPIIILSVFSCFALEGKFGIKILWSISAILIIMIASLISGSIIGTISRMSYNDLVTQDSVYVYLATGFAQILIFFIMTISLRLKKSIGLVHSSKEIMINILMPIISILTITSVIEITRNQSVFHQNIWFCVAVTGIFLIDILSYALFGIMQQHFKRELEHSFEKAAYESQRENIENIRELYIETAKIRHDLKNYVTTTKDLLENNKTEHAIKFLDSLEDDKIKNINSTVHTENPIIDMILNRKIAVCKENGISSRCFVNGNICSVSDVDISILLGNLLDNAIEAAMQSDKKSISIEIFAEPEKIEISIMNSSIEGALENNPMMMTTKKNSKNHGFGMMNISDVVKKYKGEIRYKNHSEDMVLCRTVLYI